MNNQKEKFEGVNKYEHVSSKSRIHIFTDNLIGGVAWGVGSIIGATIIIGVLGLVISRSRNIPLVGDVVNVILDEIRQGRDSSLFR